MSKSNSKRLYGFRVTHAVSQYRDYNHLYVEIFPVDSHDTAKELVENLGRTDFDFIAKRAAKVKELNREHGNKNENEYFSNWSSDSISMNWQQNVGETSWYGLSLDRCGFNPDCLSLLQKIHKIADARDEQGRRVGAFSPSGIRAVLINMGIIPLKHDSEIHQFIRDSSGDAITADSAKESEVTAA